MAIRKAEAEWKGNLIEGSGLMKLGWYAASPKFARNVTDADMFNLKE